MNLQDIAKRMDKLHNWSLEGNTIVKIFSFPDFKMALEFVNKIAEIAEKQNHHPDILISHNMVRILLTTYSQKMLTDNDFDFAEEVDKIRK